MLPISVDLMILKSMIFLGETTMEMSEQLRAADTAFTLLARLPSIAATADVGVRFKYARRYSYWSVTVDSTPSSPR